MHKIEKNLQFAINFFCLRLILRLKEVKGDRRLKGRGSHEIEMSIDRGKMSILLT